MRLFAGLCGIIIVAGFFLTIQTHANDNDDEIKILNPVTWTINEGGNTLVTKILSIRSDALYWYVTVEKINHRHRYPSPSLTLTVPLRMMIDNSVGHEKITAEVAQWNAMVFAVVFSIFNLTDTKGEPKEWFNGLRVRDSGDDRFLLVTPTKEPYPNESGCAQLLDWHERAALAASSGGGRFPHASTDHDLGRGSDGGGRY